MENREPELLVRGWSPDIFYKSQFAEKVELYPRGESGQDDHLGVRLLNAKSGIKGELSFIGSDGSLICSKQVQTTLGDESVLGPKFDEVVARSIKDPIDEITMLFRMQRVSCLKQFACTTLCVSEVSLKIDSKFMENFKSVQPEEISYIRYSPERNKGIALEIVRQDGRILLMMKPYANIVSSVFLTIDMSILSKDSALIRKEGLKHVFVGEKAWTFLRIQESEEKGASVILLVKITNGGIVQRYNYGIHTNKVSLEPKTIWFSEQKSLTIPVPSNSSIDSTTVLKEELMCLYQDQDFSDVTLKCDDVTFPVHKNILSARSPVFKTMLSSNMREAASSEVVITDLDPSTLARFLTFLYTGAVGEEGLQVDSALNLYYAADKYQVASLKKECVDFLIVNVSLSNVCDVLSFGDKHGDDDLISASHNYILENNSEVLKSKEWDIFLESEPKLALKTLSHFAREKYVVKKIESV